MCNFQPDFCRGRIFFNELRAYMYFILNDIKCRRSVLMPRISNLSDSGVQKDHRTFKISSIIYHIMSMRRTNNEWVF